MSEKKYNGWANYETWLANLWLDQDSYAIEEISNICLGLMGSWEDKNDVTWRLSDSIKELLFTWVEQDEGTNGFVNDLISAAFHQIDFREIAGHYYDELKDLEELEND